MVSSLVAVSVGVFALSVWRLLLHQVSPPKTAKRTTAMRSPFGFMNYLLFHQVARPKPTMPSGKMITLSQNSTSCSDDHAQPEHEVEFLRGQGERTVFGGFGTNADQVFIGAEPVDHVDEQIGVAQGAGAHGAVFSPLRGADDDEAAGWRTLQRSGGAQGERTFLSLLGIDSAVRGNLSDRDAVLGGAEEFLDRALAAGLDIQRAGHREGGGHAVEGARNGARFVLENNGDFGAGAKHVADAAEIAHQIFVRSYAPVAQHVA